MIRMRNNILYSLLLLLFLDLHASQTRKQINSSLPSQLYAHPAIRAAQRGDFIQLALLTDIPATEGQQALHEAVSQGHIDCARFLLYWGIKPFNHTYSTAQQNYHNVSHLDPYSLSLKQLQYISIHNLLLLVENGAYRTTTEELE